MTGPIRRVLHVDMDAFFASVELLDDPDLVGLPVIVGGSGPRGVVAAASYEARVHGVHSAQPMTIARRRCPDAVIIDGRHGRYQEVSAEVMAIFGDETPLVEPLSLDEAFLDVSGRLRRGGTAVEIARRIRRRVFDEVGLTCSVGIAPNKFLAKLVTDEAKPRIVDGRVVPGSGIHELAEDEVSSYLRPLPVARLWGVGPATLAKLEQVGVATVGDLDRLPAEILRSVVGVAAGDRLAALARGIDERRVEPDQAAKSVSHEETFPSDIRDPATLHRELLRMSDAVAHRLRTAGLGARTVSIKVRDPSFATVTRSRTLSEATRDVSIIYRIAGELLDAVDTRRGVRLLGVGTSQLTPEPTRQLALDLGVDEAPPASEHSERLGDAVDSIRARFGRDAIGPAALARPDDGLDVFVQGGRQWGPNSVD